MCHGQGQSKWQPPMVNHPGVYLRTKKIIELLFQSYSFTSSLSHSPLAICSIGLDMLFQQGHLYWSRNVGQKFMLALAMLTVSSLMYYLSKSQANPLAFICTQYLDFHGLYPCPRLFLQSRYLPILREYFFLNLNGQCAEAQYMIIFLTWVLSYVTCQLEDSTIMNCWLLLTISRTCCFCSVQVSSVFSDTYAPSYLPC